MSQVIGGTGRRKVVVKKPSTSVGPAHVALPVHGLDTSHRGAMARGRRRRRVNAFKTGVMAVLAVGVLGAAAYVGWTEFVREPDDTSPATNSLTPREAIERLENEPVWNGPGNPNCGVGDDAP